MIKAIRTLNPGDPGTKKVLRKYGDRLICVRYRFDTQTNRRYKTVELIEDQIRRNSGKPGIPMNKIVDIRIHVKETRTRGIVKAAGGRWDPQKQTWRLPYREVKNLGLEKRMVLDKREK